MEDADFQDLLRAVGVNPPNDQVCTLIRGHLASFTFTYNKYLGLPFSDLTHMTVKYKINKYGLNSM